MKPPKIVVIPHPALRKTAKPITDFTPELADLAQAMIQRMHLAEGVGLAANQVDFDGQMFVYGIEPFEDNGRQQLRVEPQVIINPKITVLDATTETMDEACLSIPGILAPVARPISIRLEAQDLSGQPIIKEVSHYEARVIQHETDHLNGILFLDHVTDPSKIRRGE